MKKIGFWLLISLLLINSTIFAKSDLVFFEPKTLKALEEELWLFAQGVLTSERITPARYYIDQGATDFAFSETLGLRLEYLLMREEKELFQQELTVLKNFFLSPANIIQWQIFPKSKTPNFSANASVDDLRILKALILGATLWPELQDEIFSLASLIAQTIEQHQFFSQGLIADNLTAQKRLWWWHYSTAGDKVYFSYCDVLALKLIAESAEKLALNKNKWQLSYYLHSGLLADNGNALIIPKKISYPELEIYYPPQSNMINNLMALIYLAEINYYPQNAVTFLKAELAQGQIWGQYIVEDALIVKPLAQKFECPSVYALAVILGCKLNDFELSNQSLKKLLQFINDLPPYGKSVGFVSVTEPFHLFSHYLALIALNLYQKTFL